MGLCNNCLKVPHCCIESVQRIFSDPPPQMSFSFGCFLTPRFTKASPGAQIQMETTMSFVLFLLFQTMAILNNSCQGRFNFICFHTRRPCVHHLRTAQSELAVCGRVFFLLKQCLLSKISFLIAPKCLYFSQ